MKLRHYEIIICNICHKTLTRIEKLCYYVDLSDKQICSNCVDVIDYNSKGVIV